MQISCPTHENCRDFVNLAQREGIQAVAFPKLDFTNCENLSKAANAQAAGLDVSETVCRSCPGKHRCGRRGYKQMVRDFRMANHQVVTHQRVSLAGLGILAANKSLVVVQEDAIRFLRASAAVPYAHWHAVRSVLHEVVHCSLRRKPDPQIVAYAGHLLQVISAIDGTRHRSDLHQIEVTQLQIKPPGGWYESVYDAISTTGASITADALQGAMDLLAGRAEACYRPEQTGGWPKPMEVVIARRTEIPAGMSVVLEDHTADLDAVQRMAGRPVLDATSFAFPEAIHRVVQLPVDVKKKTTPKTAVDQLRGILLARPTARKIGVICHKAHMGAITQMEPIFWNRISILDYFWSGNGRASNRWHKQCDLLVILGTPRVGESAVQEHLICQGLIDAAKRDGHFSEAIGLGETETGRQLAFPTLSYTDKEWNDVYRQLVVAELMQSVGRSRFIRPEGIPETIVVSNEPLDLPLADENFSRITSEQAELYAALVSAADAQQPRLSQTSYRGGGLPAGTVQRKWARKVPSIYYGDFRAPSLPEPTLPTKGIGSKRLARILENAPSTIRGRLTRLCDSGLISKCSHSGFWPVVFPV